MLSLFLCACFFFFFFSQINLFFFAEQICETLKPYYCKEPFICHFILGAVQISTASKVNAYYPLHC